MPRHSASSRRISARPRYLSYGDVSVIAYELADAVFARWLGPMPILQLLGGQEAQGRLEGILQLPRQSARGKPAYPTIFDKAAALARSIILDHVFLDGNKRMGIAICVVFLQVNGWVLAASQSELVRLALTIARGEQKEVPPIADWLRHRSVAIEALEQAILTGTLDTLVASLPGRARLRSRPLLAAEHQRLRALQ